MELIRRVHEIRTTSKRANAPIPKIRALEKRWLRPFDTCCNNYERVSAGIQRGTSKRALWGLYSLNVILKKTRRGEKRVEKSAYLLKYSFLRRASRERLAESHSREYHSHDGLRNDKGGYPRDMERNEVARVKPRHVVARVSLVRFPVFFFRALLNDRSMHSTRLPSAPLGGDGG